MDSFEEEFFNRILNYLNIDQKTQQISKNFYNEFKKKSIYDLVLFFKKLIKNFNINFVIFFRI